MTHLARRLRTVLFAVAGLLMTVAGAVAEVKLIMFDRHGCYYCERWKAEIMPAYLKSPEGKIAPLEILDIDDVLPEGLKLASRPSLSPTFVLIDDNREVARIEGYPGDEMFWWMLDGMLARLPEEKRQEPET